MGQKIKKLGIHSTVVLTSLSLAACGGGGSGGYYGNNNTNTNNGNENTGGQVAKEATGVVLSVSKNELNVKGDEVTVTAKAVDKDGGGVVGKVIVLNIADYTKNGATSDASEKTTDASGNVSFVVKLDGSNASLSELTLTTTLKGTTINNIRKISVSGAGTVVQSQYELMFDTATALPVSGGETTVRVRAVDTNGGGVPNESVALSVKDFRTNGITIKGSSNAVTNNEGYAVYTLVLPTGKEADRASLISSGVALEAKLTEISGATKTQSSVVAVSSVKNVVSNLSIATSNNNKVDAVNGTMNVVVKAKNPEGNPVVNKTVKLALDDLALEYGAKLMNATAVTDNNGDATFTIKTESNTANPTGQLLVTNGISVTAMLSDQTNTLQTSKISVVATPDEEVSYLTALVADQIEINGSQAKVTITAKDKNGGSVANKQIILNIPASQSNGLTIVNGSKLTTDNNGQATFTLQFSKNNLSDEAINQLLTNGVTVSAIYNTVANTSITQTTKINFYKKQTIDQSQEVQRLELTASKGVVSSKNDTVQIKVRAINTLGQYAANKSVSLGLTAAATENGVTFEGSATKTTDSSGYATYTLKINAQNEQAVKAIVASGIAVAVNSPLTDGTSIKQNMQVMVEAVTLEAVDVNYLTISTDQMINVKGGKATVTVKAVDSNGGVLTNQNILLKIENSAENHLTINKSQVSTNSEGNAVFELTYDGSITDSTLLSKLKTNGIMLTAIYQPTATSTAVTQTTRIRYYDQAANVDVKQVNINLSKGVVVAGNDEVVVTVKAVDENGQSVANRKISLALADVAKNNGVSITSASSQTTTTGEAQFKIKLAAPNTESINNLVTSGLLVTASVEQQNGNVVSQSAKMMVVASASAQADVAYLSIANLNAINLDANAEKEVIVKAFNSRGIAVANKDIELKLATQYTGISIKEGSKLSTNASGEVKFTLVYDSNAASNTDKDSLLQNGLMINVNHNSLTQTLKASFYKPLSNIQRMDLVVDKPALSLNTLNAQPVTATVTLKDNAGQPIKNRQVSLALNTEALQNGVNIAGISGGLVVLNTDNNGQANVTLNVNPKTDAAIANLIVSGIGIGASVVQGDGSGVITQNTKITILSEVAQNEVGYLTAASASSIATTGGTSVITVKAFNNAGNGLAGKTVKLNLGKIPNGLDIKVDAVDKVTGADGVAQFIVKYTATSGLTAEQITALLAGLQATATYTTSAGKDVNQATLIQFYSDQVNIQRMDLVTSKPVLTLDSSSEENILTTVTLKDKDGQVVKNRQVTLTLDNFGIDNNSIQNAIGLKNADGSNVIGGLVIANTNDQGQAKIFIQVKNPSKDAINALVTSGISITASAAQGDGSGAIIQNTKINVVSGLSLNDVGYLTVVGSNTIPTTGGTSKIIVKAFNSAGTALNGKLVNLNLSNLPTGLNFTLDTNTQTTNASGEAQFTLTYNTPSSLTETQVKALLAGIQVTATYSNGAGQNVTQNTVVQFNIDANEVAKDATRIELNASKGAVIADNDTFTFTTKVLDKNGNPIVGKRVGLGLNAAATENGVSLDKNNGLTDANGIVTFNVNVKASDDQKITNLVASGITVAASVVQSDGTMFSQNTKVMVNTPAIKNVAALEVVVDASQQSVSTLGGKSVIGVKAVDQDGKVLANRNVNFALSASISSRVSVDKTSAFTDSQGMAYFTVTVSEGNIENLLLEKGIVFAVTTYNSGSTKPINQIGKVNVTAPVEATNLNISASKNNLLASGDSAEVYAKLVDQTGAAINGYPVMLTVKDSALNGITINGVEKATALTDSSGNTKFKIDLTKITGAQYDALLANGVEVIASIKLANGAERSSKISLKVNEPINTNKLIIGNSKNTMIADGDRSVVTVALRDMNGELIRNQSVKLIVKQTASTTATNVGIALGEQDQTPERPLVREATVVTDNNGNGFFTLVIPSDGHDKDTLIQSGIELEAVHVNSMNISTSQVYRIPVTRAVTPAPQPLAARYSLRIDAVKPSLNVRDDMTDVNVTLVDANGGGVSGQYVTLALVDFVRNGALIIGPSGRTTNENGQATFKVRIGDNSRPANYSSNQFAIDDLNMTASFGETGYVTATQPYRINVVQSEVPNPVASIVIGVNPTGTASSSDGVYYTRNLSVSVVDFDGKPLPNQEVVMDITPISYIKGEYVWALGDVVGSAPSAKWIAPNESYYKNYDYINAANKPMMNNGTPNDISDDVEAVPYTNIARSCLPAGNGAAVSNNQVTNIPVKVPTFLGQDGATATYKTDNEGKFDFVVRYPKIYAQWLGVEVSAKSTIASLPSRTSYKLGLSSINSDYSSDGTYGPNLRSPYGTNTTACP